MKRFRMLPRLALAVCVSWQSAPTYPHELEGWLAWPRPPETDTPGRVVWGYASNYSPLTWVVALQDGKVRASLDSEPAPVTQPRPPFEPQTREFRSASTFAQVEDGWIVGFNRGEFGAALYWFSSDGKRQSKISDHQIEAFLPGPDGLLAIEGLAHMGLSRGSVIRIERNDAAEAWQAQTLLVLPAAPRTAVRARDGRYLVTLSDSIVVVTRDGDAWKLEELIHDEDLGGLYATSSALSPDGSRLYVAMRQFVGELDLKTRALRWLVPDPTFVNRLPAEEEARLRKVYGG